MKMKNIVFFQMKISQMMMNFVMIYEIEDYKKELYNDYEEEVAEEEPKAKKTILKAFF